ncbi:hypothetical protein [Dictyobacter kobayashii]|uniref:hypothetical protein n=1 Tax=Dictyobacter kobayashii TaxID=2014872 RepID=UPI000F84090E|nr:hypothetical protein [Dictyobacter kobayashii]
MAQSIEQIVVSGRALELPTNLFGRRRGGGGGSSGGRGGNSGHGGGGNKGRGGVKGMMEAAKMLAIILGKMTMNIWLMMPMI